MSLVEGAAPTVNSTSKVNVRSKRFGRRFLGPIVLAMGGGGGALAAPLLAAPLIIPPLLLWKKKKLGLLGLLGLLALKKKKGEEEECHTVPETVCTPINRYRRDSGYSPANHEQNCYTHYKEVCGDQAYQGSRTKRSVKSESLTEDDSTQTNVRSKRFIGRGRGLLPIVLGLGGGGGGLAVPLLAAPLIIPPLLLWKKKKLGLLGLLGLLALKKKKDNEEEECYTVPETVCTPATRFRRDSGYSPAKHEQNCYTHYKEICGDYRAYEGRQGEVYSGRKKRSVDSESVTEDSGLSYDSTQKNVRSKRFIGRGRGLLPLVLGLGGGGGALAAGPLLAAAAIPPLVLWKKKKLGLLGLLGLLALKKKKGDDQECWQVPEQHCVKQPHEVCHDEQKCWTVPVNECKKVPRQECWVVNKQQCKVVPRQECTQVPKTHCTQVKIF